MRRKFATILCLALFVVTAVVAVATAEEGEACSKEALCAYYDIITQTADIAILEGGESGLVRLIFENTTLFAWRVTLYKDADGEDWTLAVLEDAVRVEREGTIITAEQARLALDDEVYLFEGQVHVVEQKEKIREIWSDNLEYHGESGNMTAEGNVRMEEEGRWFRSKRMVYDADAEQALLEGDVTVVDDKGEIAVQRLDISLKDESFTGFGPGRLVLRDFRKSSGDAGTE